MPEILKRLRSVAAGWLLFGAASLHAAAACQPLPSNLTVDQSWGGTRVRFAALEADAAIYVGYYDAERWLAVSRIDKCTGALRKVRIESQFAGWDAHNDIVMALDSEGRLHVAGNMHASPMVYARMSTADNLDSLRPLRPTAARPGDRITYPQFFRFADGQLGLSYRVGQSGDGELVIDRFDGEGWQRWTDRPLFGAEPGRPAVSAYPTPFTRGNDGYFHVAWVWRHSVNIETTHHVAYARSKNLREWENSRGELLKLPIQPGNAEIVDPVPPGQGLLNNIRIGFDQASRPVISYLKFDEPGASQLHHARLESAGWRVYQTTRWKLRWDPRGGGTIAGTIAFGGVVWNNGQLVERVTHPEVGNNRTLLYGPSDLSVAAVLPDYPWPDRFAVHRPRPEGTVLSGLPLPPATPALQPRLALSWISMPADMRDLPRPCPADRAPCQYAYELQLNRLDVSPRP